MKNTYEETDNAYSYTFKSPNANNEDKNQRKALDIRVITDTADVTGLSVYFNSEPLDYLNIFKDSQPEKVAYEFCVKHKMNYEYLQPLTMQLKELINKRNGIDSYARKKQNSLDDLPESPIGSNKDKKNKAKKGNRPMSSHERRFMKQSTQSVSIDSKKTPILFPLESYHKMHNKSVIHPSKSNTNYYHKQQSLSSKSASSALRTKTNHSIQQIQNKTEDNGNIDSKKHDRNVELQDPINQLLGSKVSNPPSIINRYTKKLNCSPLNFGERLFHKGVKLQERSKDKLLEYTQEKDKDKESKQLTFHPATNPISYNALTKRYIDRKTYNDNKTIINYRDYVNKRITDLRQKHNYMEEYSFTPSLDKNSVRIENSKEGNKDKKRYECLYELYKNQQVNKAQLANQIYNKATLFKPTINDYNCAYTSMSFNDRQGYFLSKSLEKLKQNKDHLNSTINKETGKPLFHPQINEDYQCTTQYRTTFNDLYLHSTLNKNKLKEKEELSNNVFYTLQNSSHINKESSDIFETVKERTFKKIFKCLDRNQEGIITYIYMDTKALPKNIQEILKPIFIQLKEENVSLNEEEFNTACFHLFEVLSYVQKKELIAFNRKTKNEGNGELNLNQFTFKPRINEDRNGSRLNKSSQSISSMNKGNELNSLRHNALQQHYQYQMNATGVFAKHNNDTETGAEDNKEYDARILN